MNLFTMFCKKNSGEIAKRRLKMILISEKTNCSPEILERLKEDIIVVVSKYMEIDSKGIEVCLVKNQVTEHRETVPMIRTTLPIRGTTYKRTY